MTNNGNQGIESVAQSLVDDAPHYVNAISTMSERHELSATEDILSSSGIKLIARGAKIDKQLREKLSDYARELGYSTDAPAPKTKKKGGTA